MRNPMVGVLGIKSKSGEVRLNCKEALMANELKLELGVNRGSVGRYARLRNEESEAVNKPFDKIRVLKCL